jgi:hypothetical protein
MKSILRGLALVGITSAALATGVPAHAGPAPGGGPGGSTDPAAALRSETAARRAAEMADSNGPAPVTLPHRVVRNRDGSVEVIADKAAVDKLVALAAGDECGSDCDGEDPAAYLVRAPGGPSRYYRCSEDARTIHTRSVDRTTFAELRYSPRCRTAWTRGGYYTDLAGFSYRSNGSERERVYAPSAMRDGVTRYTAMLNDAGYTYKACIDGQVGGPPLWRCTAAY